MIQLSFNKNFAYLNLHLILTFHFTFTRITVCEVIVGWESSEKRFMKQRAINYIFFWPIFLKVPCTSLLYLVRNSRAM